MATSPLVVSTSFNLDDAAYSCFNCFALNASTESITVTLPSTTWDGHVIRFIRIDTNLLNTVTFVPQGSYTVNMGASANFGILEATTIFSVGMNWFVPMYSFHT